MELSKLVEEILKITNESPYGWLAMDSSEAGEIWKLLNKELKQGQTLPIDSVSNQRELLIAFMEHLSDLSMGIDDYDQKELLDDFESNL